MEIKQIILKHQLYQHYMSLFVECFFLMYFKDHMILLVKQLYNYIVWIVKCFLVNKDLLNNLLENLWNL